MSTAVTAVEQRIRERLEADPSIQRILRDLQGQQPRYRYWETKAGWMFGWTVEPATDAHDRKGYQSFVYQPKGRGSQSGKAERWVLRRPVTHRTRRAAKARAYRLFTDQKHIEEGRRVQKERVQPLREAIAGMAVAGPWTCGNCDYFCRCDRPHVDCAPDRAFHHRSTTEADSMARHVEVER